MQTSDLVKIKVNKFQCVRLVKLNFVLFVAIELHESIVVLINCLELVKILTRTVSFSIE